MEKREMILSYREIGDHIVKLVKVAMQGSNGYFNHFEYKLVIDNEVKSTINTYGDYGINKFKKVFNGINESNIDLLIGNFKLR